MDIEKREQVFVSSTYLDLVQARQEVIQTLLEADCIPAGMELFPASDDDRWTLIKRVIDDSDYYLVIVGGRYGSIDEERNLSYTEMEFDYAERTKKPIMAFVHGDPGNLPAKDVDLSAETRARLDAFRRRVQHRMVKHWTQPSELGGQVAKSLIQIRKSHPAEGWVRARDAITPEVERELVELRAEVLALRKQLGQRRTNNAELASGDETYLIEYELPYWTAEQAEDGGGYVGLEEAHHMVGEIAVSWNRILAALGDTLREEVAEWEIQDEIGRMVQRDLLNGPEPLPEKVALPADAALVSDSALSDILAQLFALGYIEVSGSRRSPTDEQTYWILTSAGRDELLKLRARPRSPRPPGASPESDTPTSYGGD